MSNLLNKLRSLDVEKPREVKAEIKKRVPYHDSETYALSLFSSFSQVTPQLLKRLYNCDFPQNIAPQDIIFLDTETTGLSGGVGTVAFQIGVGYFTRSEFVVEQFLIHDYSQEAVMLQSLSAILKRFTVICTFNGRTFDIPLLRSRFLMNRIPDSCIPAAHADALYPSRRLWKLRLHSCNLGNLEEKLLGVSREDDLPGALVPQTYFQYLKDGNFAPLEKILEHNQQDIVSLAQLFLYICYHVNHPQETVEDEDLLALAREKERSGSHAQAVKCYRMLSRGKLRPQAFSALAADEKKQGHIEAAVKLYKAMLRRGDDPVNACEALAKLCEHRLHDCAAALAYTRQALYLLSEPTLIKNETVQEKQKALQYRYARLRRKCSASAIKEEKP